MASLPSLRSNSNIILLLSALPIHQAVQIISPSLRYHPYSILFPVVLHLLIPSEVVTSKIRIPNILVFILIGVQTDSSSSSSSLFLNPITPIGAPLFLILPTVVQMPQAQLLQSIRHPANVNVQIVIKVLIAAPIMYLLQILVLVAHLETLPCPLLHLRVLRLTNPHFVLLIIEVLRPLRLQQPRLCVLPV